jgi:3-oxoacyl-[acyl-carrier-protein] synthase II
MKQKRVVVTGIGVLAPGGIGKEAFWEGLKSAESRVKSIDRFDASRFSTRIAAVIDDFDAAAFVPRRVIKKCDRFTHFAIAATDLAFKDAGLDPAGMDRERIGLVIGNNLGGWEFGERGLYQLYQEGPQFVSPYQASAWFPAAPQGQISLLWGLKGFSKTVVAERASGAVALAYGMRAITQGHADVIVAGGTEAPISPYGFLCYCVSGLLSTANEHPAEAYRPFDLKRDGLVIGEGSGMLVLEELDHALARGARIYGEIAGYGLTSDGQHPTNYGSNANQFARAMRLALQRGGLEPAQIDYVCADGAGSVEGDRLETEAIKAVFGERAGDGLLVSAPKSAFGHLMGAAGAVDAATVLLSMESGVVAPTINYRQPDPDCDLDYVPNQPREASVNAALVNARGQGGVNCVLALRRFES